MAGGNWTVQDKVRPGAYINVKSKGNTMNASSNRGIVTLPVVLGFGPTKEVVEVDSLTNFIEEFGYDLASTELLTVHEALKQASKVIVYRVNTGEKAKADSGDLSVTALHGGKRGNDLSVIVKVNIDDSEAFDVVTLLDTQVVAKQTAKTIEDLVGNHFVVFTGTGNLSELAGLKLIGGTDAPTTASDYSDYFKAIEVYDFNTMALPVSDAAIKNTAASFIKRLREEEGKKSQLVVANFSANSEAVINVKNGVKLSDGSLIPAEIATAWVAAATAQANVNESLTYYPYPNAVDVEPRYTNTEIIEALKAGSFLFTEKRGTAVVEQDINSLVYFTEEKNQAFSKNRVLRVIDDIANATKKLFEDHFLGKVTNDSNGRDVFKVSLLQYLSTLTASQAIQNFVTEDLTIEQGNDVDSLIVQLAVQPTDSMEKLYMNVIVK